MTNQNKAILAEYRNLLTRTEQESQAEYDKAVLALSGGALGLSFAFTKDVVGTENLIHTGYLLTAWIASAVSSTSVLTSFFTSQMALRKAIHQLDERTGAKESELVTDSEKMERPGGWYDRLTAALNVSGGLLFIFGLVMMMFFVSFNLKDHMDDTTNGNTQSLTEGQIVPKQPPLDGKLQSLAGKLVPVAPPTSAKKVTLQTSTTSQTTTTKTEN